MSRFSPQRSIALKQPTTLERIMQQYNPGVQSSCERAVRQLLSIGYTCQTDKGYIMNITKKVRM